MNSVESFDCFVIRCFVVYLRDCWYRIKNLTNGNMQEQFSKLVRSTVERLTVGGKTVVIVYPIPETGYDVPRTLAKLVLVGRDPSQFTRPKDYYVRRQKFVFDVFDELGPTIIRIRPDLRLCDDLKCIVYANGKSLYFDDDHLSRAGTNYLSDMFDPLFKRNGLTETAKP